ncbi:metalloregulator ArsR/SmtB family transcription factor [Frigoribacterium sp. CFBP9039]|uniref:ArsR/SmtB family transcription factor n=1 Tax=Frigoribacterium TaxID=96492 RepID=UPI001780323A|nr:MULTISPECIES: metalloregulator ArsR/SmtB family transcription factor [Frigoribacterium]MBD8702657.1 winged helix-turn-helix transcriptional regulator [Frigoribacterium sp. CFBP 13712]MCJ0701994.1 metalloregulator ArsR/SmtB family transcription factor [Frigoribacterium faeni]MDY0946104.1 metalloregulator ArsR/SmtB family transcription factor [Frigoribacterium sp. CFBP9039]
MPDLFAVIADGTRRDLLAVLLEARVSGESATGDVSVGELVSRLGISQPTVSKHLRVLRDAGLVHVREGGQHRFYGIDTAPLETVEDWLIPFLGVEVEIDTAAGGAFAAWAGASVPAPFRRAAESIPDAGDVGSSLGRAVADAQHRASSALHDASSALDERVIEPVRKRLGRGGV